MTFGGGATVTAEKGVFGTSSSASGPDATVSGGIGNTATGGDSTVSGGSSNTASGDHATVSGGYMNAASKVHATVSGGGSNSTSGPSSTVSGGYSNSASNSESTVSGGTYNTASGLSSTVASGTSNTAQGTFSFAAGRRAKADHQGAFVWGDSVDADKTSSANDQFNVYAEGGARIFAVGQTTPSLVVDPRGKVGIQTSSPGFALEVNGVARAQRGTFGEYVSASGSHSTVSGGYVNAASKVDATVSGGGFNSASGSTSTVSGGYLNSASNSESTVSGGTYNTASGLSSTVAGGTSNTAQGAFSFAAGRRAKADHQGAFVWGDSFDADKHSSANDEFNVYASGGARIFSNSAATTGVLLAPGGGSWTSVSDRNAKENF